MSLLVALLCYVIGLALGYACRHIQERRAQRRRAELIATKYMVQGLIERDVQ